MKLRIEGIVAKDKQMAAEIISFMAGTLKISPDNSDFTKVKAEISGSIPDYSRFLFILATNDSTAGSIVVETMRKRVENHIKFRGMMLNP